MIEDAELNALIGQDVKTAFKSASTVAGRSVADEEVLSKQISDAAFSSDVKQRAFQSLQIPMDSLTFEALSLDSDIKRSSALPSPSEVEVRYLKSTSAQVRRFQVTCSHTIYINIFSSRRKRFSIQMFHMQL